MEKQNLQRGIYLKNRFWDRGLAVSLQKAFSWWRGGRFNKVTFVFVAIVFTLNLFIVFPIFKRDVSASFSSSAFLSLSYLFDSLHIISKSQLFKILTILALSFAPVSFYLFVRRIILRHELTAFIATLVFFMPTPISPGGLPLVAAILSGDGAHAFAFAFIPLLLLYIRGFISIGVPAWGVMSVFGIATISIISPFASFNLIIISTILCLAHGFLGGLRIKLSRLLFLLVFSFALSFFWYYPSVIMRIAVLSHVGFTIQKFWSVFPLAIPAIPVLGIISFLVFDKRDKLNPVFIGFSLFLIYVFLLIVSKTLNITGIFTADRYLIEFSFAASFLFAILFTLFIEGFIREYIFKTHNKPFVFFSTLCVSFLAGLVGMVSVSNIRIAKMAIATKPIINHYNVGLGTIERVFDFGDISFLIATFISFATFIFLIFILVRFPSLSLLIKKEEKK